MTLPAKGVAWVLPLLLTGCIFHRDQKAPVQALAPPLKIASTVPPPTQLPPPQVTIPAQPTVAETKLPEQTAKPRIRHRKPPANPETEQAALPTPAVSAIGQLSSGDPAGFRNQTEASIEATQRGLDGIKRSLNYQEQKTADHIRDFLKQAKNALASGDVDGASTLAAKAKVLLAELQH